jgi:hypothetical protein
VDRKCRPRYLADIKTAKAMLEQSRKCFVQSREILLELQNIINVDAIWETSDDLVLRYEDRVEELKKGKI